MIYVDLFAWQDAESVLLDALALAHEVDSTNFIRVVTTALASVYTAQRRFIDADRLLDAAIDANTPMDTAGQRGCLLARAESQLARGDARSALDNVEHLLRTTEPGVAPRVWRVHGDALGHLGKTSEAVEVLEAARAAATASGLAGRLWRIEASLTRVLRSLGRRDEAERVLESARSTVQSLSLEIDHPRLREQFLRGAASVVPPASAPTPARTAKARFGGLTSRERDVARLIARGLSNRAIADQLIVGERTVESYVANILSKLRFGSRTQIAAWVVESGLSEVTD